MAMKEYSGQGEEKRETIPSEADEKIPAEIKEPEVPKGMSDEEVQEVKSRAAELAEQLGSAAGSVELELLDSIANVGLQAQRNAASQLDLMKTWMGAFLNEGGTSKEIANGLRDLRMALTQINPHEMAQPSAWYRVLDVLPFLKGRYNPVVRAMNKIALRYEPVSRQVVVIETKLREGRVLLARDNVELRKLYEEIETQQTSIRRNMYLGELIVQQLSQLLEHTGDSVKRDRIQTALHDVVMRVQDLRTMEEVHIQYFVSIEMSRQNNNRLGQSVERTLTLATNVVTVGLAIQSALISQNKVMEATQRTREFLGAMVVANAVAIRRHTQEIGDLYNNPVIAVEKMAQAHNDLVEALDTASRLRQEGIEAGRDNIAKLGQMSASLVERVSGLSEERDSRPASIEA